jgi:hypothetical protein
MTGQKAAVAGGQAPERLWTSQHILYRWEAAGRWTRRKSATAWPSSIIGFDIPFGLAGR